MYAGRIVFAQLIDHLPLHSFRRSVQRYRGHYKVQSFSCLDQYLCMAFAQLSYRESLRDIDASLYTILQVLSLTVFEKTPLLQMLSEAERTDKNHPQHKQLNLFE
jgi:hypothetical protein